MMTYGSLFSGCGGADLGFDAAGLQCAFQCEIEAKPRSVLQRHWPDVPKFNDVRKVGNGKGRKKLPPVDVLVGGFPCQDLSVAGNRGGLDGERSGLFYELVRIARELRPKFLVFENVPGLLSSDDGRDLARVLRHLGDSGFGGGWRVLDAQHFGVAQQRRRVFGVFAGRDIGIECCGQILALADGVRGHPAPGQEARPGVAGTVTGSTNRAGSHESASGHIVGGNGPAAGVEAGVEAGAGQLVYGGGDTRGPRSVASTLLAGTQAGSRGDFDSENFVLAFNCKDDGGSGELSPTLRAMGHDKSHANAGGQVAVAYKIKSANSCDKANHAIETEVARCLDRTGGLATNQGGTVVMQCQGSNVGPMGTLRQGNGHTTGGVPFVFHMRSIAYQQHFASMKNRRTIGYPKTCKHTEPIGRGPESWDPARMPAK